MTKIAGSGSISQRHGSAGPDPDPDPHEICLDPEHWFQLYESYCENKLLYLYLLETFRYCLATDPDAASTPDPDPGYGSNFTLAKVKQTESNFEGL